MKNCTRILIILIFALACSRGSYALTAGFTASATSGCVPLVVNFHNTSTGATSYWWNLGNSVTTPATNASTSYTLPGTYTVTLTAYSGGSSSVSTMVITVYPEPTVSFYSSDTIVCPGAPVYFVNATSGGVPGPVSYLWNFGDGVNSTVADPTHTYATSGFYNITLTATNAEGCVASVTHPDYIHVLIPSVPAFTTTPAFACHGPLTVTFTNTSTGFPPFTINWAFGDGSAPTTGSPVTHTFTGPGIYNITLTETDINGCTDSIMLPAVNIASVVAAFTGPATVCLNTSVEFMNGSSDYTVSEWNFGNGATSTATNGTTEYTTPGTYTVTLVVFNGICSDTVTHTITVMPNPTGSFSVSPVEPCGAPVTAGFTATLPAGATVTWDFGDGALGIGVPATHNYSVCGSYTVSMRITTSAGCKDTIKEPYNIYQLVMDINNGDTASGCVPLLVNFDAEVFYDCPTPPGPYPYPITSFTWNYGDGSPTTSGSVVASHTYTAVGVYTCTVHIVTANGCTDSARELVYVGAPPTVSATVTPATVCYGDSIYFLNFSTGAGNFLWVFGDGTTDTSSNPAHFFTNPGVYSVTVYASYNGCWDSFTIPTVITIDSPKAIIVDTFLCSPRTMVDFYDSSLGDVSRVWFFGDGDTSSLADPAHNYATTGIYTVTLATYNSRSGCHDTTREVIDLIVPTLRFSAADSVICRYGTTTLTATALGAGGFEWFLNGIADTVGPVFTPTLSVAGYYTVMLTATDNLGCRDTLRRPAYLVVDQPDARFGVSPDSGCTALNAFFTDSSSDFAGFGISSYVWLWGDGTSGTTTVAHTSHIYYSSGLFTITEVITDAAGCKDTAYGRVRATAHIISFHAAPTGGCVGIPVNFYNTSSGYVSCYWQFGDGTSSTLDSPTHVYTDTGHYTVSLEITDLSGCTDTSTMVRYIVIHQPKAAFKESDSFAICTPVDELFTNQSVGAVRYLWSFGDGASSTLLNPADIYVSVGDYTVTLIAYDSYGCPDTAVNQVIIFGYTGGFNYNIDTGCAPLTVYFTSAVTNASSIIWDFGDGTTSSAHSTADTVHTYVLPGAYMPKLILSDLTGCQNSCIGQDTIKVDTVYTSFTKTPACINEPINLQNTSYSLWSVVDSVRWTLTPPGTTVYSNSVSVSYFVPGTFTVSLWATDAWGCPSNLIQQVTVDGLPTITATGDTIICLGDGAKLKAKGGLTYTWTPSGSLSCATCNPTIATPNVPVTYTVTGVDSNGCKSTDTTSVFLKTKTVSVSHGDTSGCAGYSIDISDSGANKFTWLPPTGLNDNSVGNPVATPNVTTTYTVVAQLSSCIPDTNFVTLTVWQLPVINATANPPATISDNPVQLQATGSNYTELTWLPALNLSCYTCANPIATVRETTSYTVFATSEHGCLANDSVTIHIYCISTQVFMPAAFTPNNDGVDDVFYPRGSGIEIIKSFRVFNRWGQLVFEKFNFPPNDANFGWDGTFTDSPPRPDVYVYELFATCESGQQLFKKGDVTLIK